MEIQNILTEKNISDFLLCDPITAKGKRALERLGLDGMITPEYFYNYLRVSSKYEGDFMPEDIDDSYGFNQEIIALQKERFDAIKARMNDFIDRLTSNSQNQCPLAIIGVAGNGKSIEVHYRLSKYFKSENDFECGKAFFNFEKASSTATWVSTFQCPEDGSNDSRWIFCVKLLNGIMEYIKSCDDICCDIRDNFERLIYPHLIANKNHRDLFSLIGNFNLQDFDSVENLFNKLVTFISLTEPINSIKELLKIQMMIMYCSAPKKSTSLFSII